MSLTTGITMVVAEDGAVVEDEAVVEDGAADGAAGVADDDCAELGDAGAAELADDDCAELADDGAAELADDDCAEPTDDGAAGEDRADARCERPADDGEDAGAAGSPASEDGAQTSSIESSSGTASATRTLICDTGLRRVLGAFAG